MKLYMHPASTASRPVMLLLQENGIVAEQQVVDLFTGEQSGDEYRRINPNGLVPTLVDGDLTLSESATILRYIADKHQTPDYPTDTAAQARVNERIDWFNSNLYKDLGYNLVYPQLFEHHKRANDAAQQGTLQWGLERTRHWMGLLDTHWLGSGNAFLTGDQITIADYFGACLIELGKVIRCDYSAYPNVEAWMERMRALPSWYGVHDTIYGFAASVEDKKFVAL